MRSFFFFSPINNKMWLILLVATLVANNTLPLLSAYTIDENPSPPDTSTAVSSTDNSPRIQCSVNETEVMCKTFCPPQRCGVKKEDYNCSVPIICQRGCDCLENYNRNSSGTCILSDDCPIYTTGPAQDDSTNNNPPNISTAVPTRDQNSSSLGSSGKSSTQSSSSSQSETSSSSSSSSSSQTQSSSSSSNNGGPSTPSGGKCGTNTTVAPCAFECPTDYCPQDDSLAVVFCSPPYVCKAGCVCSSNYLRKSPQDPSCILAVECPPVECTRVNEEWDPCSTYFNTEGCEYADSYVPSEPGYCVPKCVCKQGYYRNDFNVCVPKDECPKPECKEHEHYAYCKAECPNDYCPVDDSLGVIACDPPYPCPGGCICDGGYKRKRHDDPTCVLATECPPVNCTRPNEKWNPCSSYYTPDGCEYANSSLPPLEPGRDCWPKCVCEDGYYRNLEGICILKEQCPTDCKENEVYVNCKSECPNDYCPDDDSLGIIACSQPYPCPSGCVCKGNYRRKSYSDPTCILTSDCPPINCTRPNESYNSCPAPRAFETCDCAENSQPYCMNQSNYCEPRCVCDAGFYRDDSQSCVPKDQCN